MIKVVSANTDMVNRRVIKLYNDTDESTLTLSEFYTEDRMAVGNMLKSDSFNFAPDQELMQQIVDAVRDYERNGIKKEEV
jgi:hypothetical protein